MGFASGAMQFGIGTVCLCGAAMVLGAVVSNPCVIEVVARGAVRAIVWLVWTLFRAVMHVLVRMVDTAIVTATVAVLALFVVAMWHDSAFLVWAELEDSLAEAREKWRTVKAAASPK